jgi:hypothetical protein
MGTVILVVGLLLTGYCLLIAAKPEWFKNFRVARHDSDGDYRGSSRLGDSPPGVVRVVYLVVAGILLIGTLVIRSWVIQDGQCDEARAVYESARTDQKWAAAAEQAGFRLEITDHTRYTTYVLTRDGRPVADWSDAGYSRFSCPPGS